MAAVVLGAVNLREADLGEIRRHTQKRCAPHPKYRAWPAHDKRRCGADEVARTHLCGNGGSDGLKRTHARFSRRFAVQREVAKKPMKPHFKLKDLHETQPDREVKSGAAK